jgi:hypothetical protein
MPLSKTVKRIEMPEHIRQMMLRIWDGNAATLPLLHQLFHHPHCEAIFSWLISAHLTGPMFVAWYRAECKGSPMYMEAVLRAQVEGSAKPRLVEEEA